MAAPPRREDGPPRRGGAVACPAPPSALRSTCAGSRWPALWPQPAHQGAEGARARFPLVWPPSLPTRPALNPVGTAGPAGLRAESGPRSQVQGGQAHPVPCRQGRWPWRVYSVPNWKEGKRAARVHFIVTPRSVLAPGAGCRLPGPRVGSSVPVREGT